MSMIANNFGTSELSRVPCSFLWKPLYKLWPTSSYENGKPSINSFFTWGIKCNFEYFTPFGIYKSIYLLTFSSALAGWFLSRKIILTSLFWTLFVSFINYQSCVSYLIPEAFFALKNASSFDSFEFWDMHFSISI
jgi:hypothetical protein